MYRLQALGLDVVSQGSTFVPLVSLTFSQSVSYQCWVVIKNMDGSLAVLRLVLKVCNCDVKTSKEMILIQNHGSTQIQHSYWCKKLKSAPWALHQESRLKEGEKKNFSICPKLQINAALYDGLVLAPRLKKGYHQIWEANLQPKNAQS